jgi:hypothetical protein
LRGEAAQQHLQYKNLQLSTRLSCGHISGSN